MNSGVLSVCSYHVDNLFTLYLGPLVRVADQPGRRSLRSADSGRLVVPPIKLSTVGSRAFPVAAAELWNSLPDSVISVDSITTFRRHLKHYLFQKSYLTLFCDFCTVTPLVVLAVVSYLGHSKKILID